MTNTRLLPDGLVGHIAGATVSGSPLLPVEDPSTGAELAVLAEATAGHVADAVAAAEAAQREAWGRTAPAERGRVMSAIAALLRAEEDPLAELEALDTGKPLSQARADVRTGARYFEYYAGVADKLLGETIPSEDGSHVYTRREPLGVVAHITPWNSPISQLTRGVAPSLAAGNTVVVKPSELTPLSTFRLAELFERAGLPRGACNVLVGRGATTGAALAAHEQVAHVTFTGSVAGGSAVMTAAARRIVSVSLELGGKSPTIVCADADLDAAVAAAIAAVTRNAGQSCFATTRILVQRSLFDAYVERLCERIAQLRIGRAIDDLDLGPLASAQQLSRALALVRDAVAAGATAVAGGGPAAVDGAPGGHYCEPTVLVDLTPDLPVVREEVFGPVQCVLPYDDEEEALALANDSDYGLAAGVFTRDFGRAHRLAHRLEAGQVQINRYPAGGVETPFGGYKRSGIGREKGLEALRHYTQLKTVIATIA